MAVQHHQVGRLDEADSLYRLLLEVDPKLPDALHLFGLICLTRNQPGDAIELIERALAVNPKNAAYHGNLGRAYAAFDDFDKALQAFYRAVEINPGSAESLASMGQRWIARTKPSNALSRRVKFSRARPILNPLLAAPITPRSSSTTLWLASAEPSRSTRTTRQHMPISACRCLSRASWKVPCSIINALLRYSLMSLPAI